MIQVAIAVLGTVLLAAVSRRSLAHPRAHGFSRFFAFAAILWLIVLVAPHWFRRPGEPAQILSWALLAVSLFLAIHGFRLLHRLGKPTLPPPGSPLYRVENTTALVTAGAYRYIRHPLYASALFGTWGAVLKAPSPPSIVLGLIATVFLFATATAEETENVVRFGDAYRDYMARTRRFIPFVL